MSHQQVMGIIPEGHSAIIATEQAKYGRDMTVTSFIPYLGMSLKGDHSNSYFGMPDASMYYANQAVAMVQKKQVNFETMHVASKNDTNSDYKRRIYDASVTTLGANYEFTYTAALKKQRWIAAKQREAQRQFIANGGQLPNAHGLPPYIAAQMYAKLNPYQGSVPPGGADSASQVVGPLTQIPFIQDVLGFPTPEYHINDLTTKVALPQLHAEQPETDWGTPNLALEPTQFVENRRPDFDSHFFLAKRNEFAFFIPREYRYRATIDPYNMYVRQASDGLRQAREALTLLELFQLPDVTSTSKFGVKIGDDILNPASNSSAGFPAASNNSKVQYEGYFAKFWELTRGMIDSIVMNPVDFAKYEANFYTNGWQGYTDISDWGILQMPGFKRNIRVSSSPFCPINQQYFFNSRFVYTGEGPMVTETWAKPEANSDAGAYRDYVDVRIFNPGRAGFKANIESTTPKEIKTLTEARDLIKPNAKLLQKNETT